LVALGAGVAFLLVAWAWIPWDPVPGGALPDVDPSGFFSPAELARAEHVAFWARVWSWASLVVSVCAWGVLGFTGLGARLVDRLPTRVWLRVPLAVAVLLLVVRLLTLPFAVALRRLALDYGLSTQSWLGFARDLAVGYALRVVVTLVVVAVIGWSWSRFRRVAPLVAGGMLAGLVLAGSFVYPVVVEPLFNRFTPLDDAALRSEILQLAREEGVAVNEVLVADASRRTTTLNAYVSGFGGTRRVVLYDNLVEDLPHDQVLAVVAHELAHARHRDVLVGSVLGALGVLAGVGLLALALAAPLSRRRATGPGDPGWVPLVLAWVAIGSLLATPVQSTLSRQVETRADVDALQTTNDGRAFADLQVALARRALSDPTPPRWSQFVFGTHPSVLRRLAIAERVAPTPSRRENP
jgi:Zn-dependent protease with chaperone function